MDKLFRQVSVKERLPDTQGGYFTNVGIVNFHGTKFNKWVEWWLEEVPIPNIDHMKYSDPDPDKYREHSDIYDDGYADGANDGYIDGFKEAIYELKGNTQP